ncbi:hypothetical protein GCM10010271_36530 [Streptomyces kurssanovii]|nr:hypothetical protein GCM10010271_36530 [Streptomyces kurssanovii]
MDVSIASRGEIVAEVAKKLSDAISEPLTRAYRVGGFGLAFLLLGALLMLGAIFRHGDTLSYALACVGIILIAVPCYFFYVKEIQPIRKAQQAVDRNKEMIDQIQETALSLMELSLLLQALAFKHSELTAEMIGVIRPKIKAIPVIGKLADGPLLSRPEALGKAIVGATRGSKELLEDINSALQQSDINRLKKYKKKLDRFKRNINRALAAGNIGEE